ncbi:HypC/HybG/HupF family hydrogenase formation chaperone [Nitrosophilus kaiyonis]|uniref:HypC/HybG/HupF family hydrogenase formation chaperone n=1 Tax=Nitrosophilus kaiyonis TaxID=2930200 RepID=UPI00248F4B23|nr:HypC/HybG/HupF family hydrogenase formation chaperone [Nitrosophilus kaiyonis]
MCLSIPSKVVSIDQEKCTAIVDTLGVQREVGIDFIADEVKVGDFVLIHIGYAMNIIDEEYAKESIALYQDIIEKMEESEKEQLINESDICPGDGSGT